MAATSRRLTASARLAMAAVAVTAVALAPSALALPAVPSHGIPLPVTFVNALLVDPANGNIFYATEQGVLITDARGNKLALVGGGEVVDLALSVDGRTLLAADVDGAIVVVDRATLRRRASHVLPNGWRPMSLTSTDVDTVLYGFRQRDYYPGGVAVLRLDKPADAQPRMVRRTGVWSDTPVVRAVHGTGLVAAANTYGSPAELALLDHDLNVVQRVRTECGDLTDIAVHPTGRFIAPICAEPRLTMWTVPALLPASSLPAGNRPVAGTWDASGGLFAAGVRPGATTESTADVAVMAGAGHGPLEEATIRYETSEGHRRLQRDRVSSPRATAFSPDATEVYSVTFHPWGHPPEEARLHVLPLRQ